MATRSHNSESAVAARVVDLRSDAVTRPTEAMWRAMHDARLGWAPAGEDSSVNALEHYAAELVGKEAALFVPTGTMANLLALMTHTERGDQIILDADSHILWSEEWSFAYICGLVPAVVQDPSGRIQPEALQEKLSGQRFNHKPRTGLICLENTHNLSGGTVIRPSQLSAVARVAREHGVPIHLDGARIFNACVAANKSIKTMTNEVDTLMFCLGKGLSAPAGALLCGPAGFIQKSVTHLKRLGGFSIPQAGVLAAAGLVALETMPPQLAEDHRRAQMLAKGISGFASELLEPPQVETNIVMVSVAKLGMAATTFVERLRNQEVLAYQCTEDRVRFVTHRHIDDEAIATAIGAVRTAVCN